MSDRESLRGQLLELAADCGDERQMAILGEGNISGKIDERYFLVKASGTSLTNLKPEHLVEVDSVPLLDAMDRGLEMDDAAIEQLLLDSRVDPDALKPSVESLFHAWFLQLPDIRFVGHVHATAVNQILCSPRAEEYATKRMFPDQIVYCGSESVLVPYVDPGLVLSRRIALEVEAFRARMDVLPKTILLVNHGIIALGKRHTEVMAALSMAEKSAQIFVGAASLGGPVFFDEYNVRRIDGRLDEHYRQRMLET
jgi:rhamnose utilization protein RhaD (predicted bifunctional aldolase and dehydrogenase)